MEKAEKVQAIQVQCPCKINLSLAITGIRKDGYHLLRSVMQTVDLYNILTIRLVGMSGIHVKGNHPQMPCDASNTAYKAARLFLKKYNIASGVDIHIQKNVPFQAGLGSASADAAGVLYALAALFPTVCTENERMTLAAQIGADVPFCLRGKTALAEGIGEIFTPLAPMPDCAILLVKPKVGASTPQIFAQYDMLKNPINPDVDKMLHALQMQDIIAIANNVGNVLEQVILLREIAEIKEHMYASSCLGASMTGSGTCVFGIYASKEAAQLAAKKFPTDYEVFVTKPVHSGVVLL